MKPFAELPLLTPMYSTYHRQSAATSLFVSNPSIRNWYLNSVMILTCRTKFLDGYTSPMIGIKDSAWGDNPYFITHVIPFPFLKGNLSRFIRNAIDEGYYLGFEQVDDYYIKGKSWYKERHFAHNGLLCGYNQEDKTYCLFAYDSNWILRKFWTPQIGFYNGIKSMYKQNVFGEFWAIKPKKSNVLFSSPKALNKIVEYLKPTVENGVVSGIVVHDYIAKYLDKLLDGSIPYERMDRRVFRLIRDHKTVMLERIQCIESQLSLSGEISRDYAFIVKESENMHMLYASYRMKRRDSLLTDIRKKLFLINEKENELLKNLLKETRGKPVK